MNGPSEFTVTGNLANYDISGRIHEISIPTLFTCGRYDECTPDETAWYQELMPGSEMVVFEDSAHMPHFEERSRYIQVIRDFLHRAEQR
jgi:proline iminopeptidase